MPNYLPFSHQISLYCNDFAPKISHTYGKVIKYHVTSYENTCIGKFCVKSMEGGRIDVCEPGGKNHISTGTSEMTNYRAAGGKILLKHLIFSKI